jgi:hypothetical protein
VNHKLTSTLIGLLVLALLLALMVAIGSAQEPATAGQAAAPEGVVGTGFTYQGRLDRSNNAVDGLCNIAFRLYEQAAGGTLVGAPVTTTVTLDHGLFTTYLDFGAGSMNGRERWLEVKVRCAGDAAFTTLPRQPLTPTPYALYAATVPWSGLTGVPASMADGVDNDTTYQAGAGLMLQNTVFSVDYRSVQQRVSGLCPAGQAVRQVLENGTVVCETTYNGDITEVVVGDGLLGGGATGLVTVTANTNYLQRRIDDTGCLGESSIKRVKVDGSLVCEADSNTAYLAGNQLVRTGSYPTYTLNVKEGANSDLDADMLDGQSSAFYQNATNINAGLLNDARFSAYSDLGVEGFLGNANGDIAQNNGTVQVNLNAEQLNGHGSLYYTNADNIVAGTLNVGRYSAWTDLMDENKLGQPYGVAVNSSIMQPGLNAQYLNGLNSGDYQRRITGKCADGQAVREVFDTGAVWCAVLPVGDITSVSGGAGIVATEESGAVTVSADTAYLQKRVLATCDAGSSIRAISAEGAVTCQVDGGTTYKAGTGISFSADNTISVNTSQLTDINADKVDGFHASDLARAGSSRLTDEYKVELDSPTDSGSTTMIATSLGFCFLVRVDFDDIDNDQEASCRITISGSNWVVSASKSSQGGDDAIKCYARCYQW